MADVASVLLEILGDNEQARADLKEVSGDLAKFDQERAEAELDVQTQRAKAEIRAIRQELLRLEGEETTPEIGARISEAQVQLRVLERELAALDRREVEVDVDVRRGALENIVGGIGGLRNQLQAVVPDFGGFARGAGVAERAGGRFGGGLRNLAGEVRTVGTILIGVLIPGMISLVGTLAPMVTVLASAAVGLGALGLAFAGAAISAGVFGLAVVKGLKEGGPAAQRLKEEVRGLGREFQDAAHTGIVAFVDGLVPAVHAIRHAVGELKPAFTAFGEAAGAAVEQLGTRVANLVPEFGALMRASAPISGPLTRSIALLAEIFLDIARAAMPLLIKGARGVADGLAKIAHATGDIQGTRGVIREMVRDFASLLRLGTAVGRVVSAVFSALIDNGRAGVRDLTSIVNEFARWAESAKGQKRIRQFFNEVFFSIRDLANFARTYGPGIAAFFSAFGKAATGLMRVLSALPGDLVAVIGALAGLAAFGKVVVSIVGAIVSVFSSVGGVLVKIGSKIGPVFSKLGGVIRAALGPIGMILRALAVGAVALAAALGLPVAVVVAIAVAITALAALIIAKWEWVKTATIAAWTAIKAWLTGVWDALKAAAQAVWNAIGAYASAVAQIYASVVVAIWQGGSTAIAAVWDALKAVASSVWAAIRGIIVGSVQAVVSLVRGAWENGKAAIQAIWGGIRSAASSIWGAIRGVITTATGAAKNAVVSVWEAGKGAVSGVWNAIKGAASNIWGGVKEAIGTAVRGAKEVAVSVFQSAKGVLVDVWQSIKASAANIWGSIKDVVANAVNDALRLISGFASNWFNLGVELIKSLVGGMKSMLDDLVNTAKDIASAPLNAAKEIFGIGSPSKVFRRLGVDTMRGFSQGLERASAGVVATMSAEISRVAPAAAMAVSSAGVAATPPSQTEINHNYQVSLTQQSLHPGDPRVQREAARLVIAGIFGEGHRPAPRQRVGL
jgi:phage-related protein